MRCLAKRHKYLRYNALERIWLVNLEVMSYPLTILYSILYIVAVRALHSNEGSNIEFIQLLLKGMCVFTILSSG